MFLRTASRRRLISRIPQYGCGKLNNVTLSYTRNGYSPQVGNTTTRVLVRRAPLPRRGGASRIQSILRSGLIWDLAEYQSRLRHRLRFIRVLNLAVLRSMALCMLVHTYTTNATHNRLQRISNLLTIAAENMENSAIALLRTDNLKVANYIPEIIGHL